MAQPIYSIPKPDTPFVKEQGYAPERSWYLFLNNLFTSTGSGTGITAVANGGTGISSGTSGGIPYYSASTTIASSGALTANNLVLGGGSGASPTVLGTLGTTSQVLHGNAGGAPSWGPIALGTDVSGTLAAAQFPALTGDVTTTQGSISTLIAANVVSNTKLAQMLGNSIKGNNTGVTANAIDLTVTQVNALLGVTAVGTAAVGQIPGTATNDNAAVGDMGEYVSSLLAIGSAISLTNNTTANIVSVSLTPGDWDVEGNLSFNGTTATITGGSGGITTVTATVPSDGSEIYDGTVTTVLSDKSTITAPRKRISVTSTTPVYLVANKLFSAGTVSAFGALTARRSR